MLQNPYKINVLISKRFLNVILYICYFSYQFIRIMSQIGKNSAKKIFLDYIFIPLILAIIAAIIIELAKNYFQDKTPFQVDFKLFFETANLLILLGFCLYSSNSKALEINHNMEEIFTNVFHPYSSRMQKVQKSTEIKDEVKEYVASHLRRTNRLVRQLNSNIYGYALCLIVVYFLYILQKFYTPTEYIYNFITSGE